MKGIAAHHTSEGRAPSTRADTGVDTTFLRGHTAHEGSEALGQPPGH